MSQGSHSMRVPGTFSFDFAMARRVWFGSEATTRAPEAASGMACLPVPQPTSRILFPAAGPMRSQMKRSSPTMTRLSGSSS